MAKSKDSSVQIAAIVIGLLVVVGGAWLFLNRGDVTDTSAVSDTLAKSIKSKSVSKHSTDDAMPVDTSLQLAEMAFQSGELVGDEEGSAMYFYRQVLAQDPENARAKAGLALINTQLVDEANGMLKKRDFSGVVKRIDYLNKISPASDEVMALEAALLEESKVMFASLDTAIEGNSFDEAEQLAQRLRELPFADSGRVNSAAVLIAKKRKDFEEEQLAAEAEAIITAKAQEETAIAVAAAAAEQERIRQETLQANSTDALLAKAKTRIDENRLFKPAGDSAADLFKQVLAVDADNSDAKRGLRGLVQKMTSRAYDAAEVGDWKIAESALSDAEKAGIADNLIEQARAEVSRKKVEIESNKVVSIDQFVIEKTVTPVYPDRAATRSIEGWVKVEFTVSDTGATTNLKVVESSERFGRSFRSAATKAIEQWRFKPRMIEGRAIAQRSQTTVQFRLEN